ncbi:glutathione S-transferase family protein [Paracoccus laeviglucosivorans]|uniref:Glutathione S-transferase n=1 Tax=Paracoccus laeviglucosivorans TaxID=1197861 RepID=A0A521CDB2_9RHOB|nr:glutathione S-transferase family protein [Paracoccus laeviglucosivorans]SMO57414.1 glutathione S-transferase [Paracoccus laeviglucosivorans]
MEPILIYGYPSGSSMALVAALEWLGQPYRLCRVDMLGEMRDPAYRRLNPRVETPVLITDDGRVVTETMAIALWLEARDDARRISFAPRSAQTDRMHQLMGFVNTGFTGAFTSLWAALEMQTPDPARQALLRDIGKDQVTERHDRLEEMIGPGPYLVGDRPSLADALLIGVARWAAYHQITEASGWPRLTALRKRLEDDPAVQYATALETGEPATGNGACRGHVALQDLITRFGAQLETA